MPVRSRSRASIAARKPSQSLVDGAQFVERGVEAVADHAAVAHQRGRFVDQRGDSSASRIASERERARQSRRTGRRRSAAARRRAPRERVGRVAQRGQFARPHRAQRDAAGDPLEVDGAAPAAGAHGHRPAERESPPATCSAATALDAACAAPRPARAAAAAASAAAADRRRWWRSGRAPSSRQAPSSPRSVSMISRLRRATGSTIRYSSPWNTRSACRCVGAMALRARRRSRAARRAAPTASGASSTPKPARSRDAEQLASAGAARAAASNCQSGRARSDDAGGRDAPASATPACAPARRDSGSTSSAGRSRSSSRRELRGAEFREPALAARHHHPGDGPAAPLPAGSTASSSRSSRSGSSCASVMRARRDDAHHLALDRPLGRAPGRRSARRSPPTRRAGPAAPGTARPSAPARRPSESARRRRRRAGSA